ncbi:MAG: hypothetical protein QF491_10800, partial [Alphaproteobacteria bacterium]|nr:hypothetical protein [Alphaproteobacteria bacterium]
MNIEDQLYRFLGLYYDLPQPISSFIGTLYRHIPRSITMGRRYSEFTDLCTELAENRELTREYVEREFIRTIRSAEKTPFYKSLYSDYGISFSSIKNIEDLPRLPTIDKISLKENFEQLIVPGQKNNSLYLTTGGSTGTPVGFLLEKGV